MKLMILDGNSIVNRAFYGVRMLNAPDGTPTNGVYGFIAILQRLLDELKPDAVCVAFDVHAPTFRHIKYPDYKGQRKPMPEELVVQMPVLKKVLDAMGIMHFEKEGWEADDILGTTGKICEEKGWECVIVTGDKDSFQLITDTTHVFHVKSRMGKTETKEYTPEAFREEYGFDPVHIVDLKALMGDSSDNIPGVPGIGEKTAMDLIQRYTTVENIYADIQALDIKDGVKKKLEAGKESAFMSYELATICRQAPVDIDLESTMWKIHSSPELYDIFFKLGFTKFIEKWNLEPGNDTVQAITAATLSVVEVLDETSVGSLIKVVEEAEYVSVLTSDNLESIDICDGKNIYHASWSGCGDEYNKLLKIVFSDKVKKISHNVKELMRVLLDEGLSADGFIFDTALAGYLLEATESEYTLEKMMAKYCGTSMDGVQAAYELYPAMDKRLSDMGMSRLMYEIELPLCIVLADMEKTGFLVDKKALYDYGQSMSEAIEVLQQDIWNDAGREFNINSPKQLGEILFDELMLPSGKKTKTGWSTNADVLEKLRGKHPIVQKVLDYRTLAKLKSTYADGLLKVISSDGRIHTSFQMTVTATGRLSSVEPNLQNIPIRKELGSEIRKMFVSPKGYCLVDADYSQIELRLLAHISDDENMQNAFLSGMDFHTVTASQVFNIPVENVSSILRSRAKAVNFGIVYGISAWSLAGDIGVTTTEAKEYMDAYYEKYSGVSSYMKTVVEKAKEDGYVTTMYGRRRNLPELKSSNFAMRSFGERVALNMPIQGTAADIIKLAMINVYNRLKKENTEAKLILQVHDELIVECPEEDKELVVNILKEEMEHVAELAVPLLVEAKSGKSWAQAH